ncbi:flippase-like domain-containing protein [Chloroflexi bacterium TSY]|nr:flippase-like domain-containing protein [Chloroflexi bacterium TSY]
MKLDRKRLLLLVGLSVLSIALLIALGGGWRTFEELAYASPTYLILAILFHYSGFAVRGHRWQVLLSIRGHRLPYRMATVLLISGWFVSALVPARAGDLVRISLLRSPLAQSPEILSVPIADSTSSIVLERVLDMSAILILGASIGIILLNEQLPDWVSAAYSITLLLLLGFIITLLLSPPLLSWLSKRWNNSLYQKVLGLVTEIVEGLRILPRSPRAGLLVLCESLYIWLCDALLFWFVILSLHAYAPFAHSAFVALTVDIFAAIPITPGGIGQIESVYGALLALLQSTQDNITITNIPAVILLTRFVSYWSFLLFSGVIAFMAGIGQILANHHQDGADNG